MPAAAPGLIAFNGGEISELAQGRIDLDIYGRCLSRCENLIPLIQGGVTRAPGLRFVAEVRDSTRPAWYVDFVFSDDDALMLVFNDGYVRFFKNREPVETSPGTPYEIAHPYADGDLSTLQWVQSADVLYFTHGSYAPRKLSRSADTSWAFSTPSFNDGPFLQENTDTSLTMSFSALTGPGVTVTMGGAGYFESGHVGSIFLVWAKTLAVSGLSPWEPNVTTSSGDRSYYNGRVYLGGTPGSAGKTGTVAPVHEEGTRYDGKQGVNIPWTFESSLYGIFRVTAVATANSATVTVLKTIPFPLASLSTDRWAEGAWNDLNGYPIACTIYNDRLTFGGSTQLPDTLWASAVGDYENFAPRDSGGLVVSDLAVTITIGSQSVNQIRRLVPDGTGILVLTQGAEFLVAPSTNNEPFGPSNVRAIPQTTRGSSTVRPVKVGPVTLFVQSGGRVLREAAFAYENDRYKSRDTTLFHPEILSGGVASMAYAQAPFGVLWIADEDGAMIGLTYDQDEELTGWLRRPGDGAGVVECLSAIPSPDGRIDDVWAIVRREVDGNTVRYIEFIDQDWSLSGDAADCFYVDSGVTKTGAAAIIDGLDHLEGETVAVWVDGAHHPSVEVSGGQIALNGTYTKRTAGLPCVSRGRSVRIEAGAADGTAQGRTKRITDVSFRVFNSVAFLAGVDGNLERTLLRDPSMPMSGPVTPLTGDTQRMPWPGGYETDGWISFEQDQAGPMTIIAAWPRLHTQEK